jgi:hypothetical protein
MTSGEDDGHRQSEEGGELQPDAANEGPPVVFELDAMSARRHRDREVASVGHEDRRGRSIEARPPRAEKGSRKNDMARTVGHDVGGGAVGLCVGV